MAANAGFGQGRFSAGELVAERFAAGQDPVSPAQ
jgi:hypothetical protein